MQLFNLKKYKKILLILCGISIETYSYSITLQGLPDSNVGSGNVNVLVKNTIGSPVVLNSASCNTSQYKCVPQTLPLSISTNNYANQLGNPALSSLAANRLDFMPNSQEYSRVIPSILNSENDHFATSCIDKTGQTHPINFTLNYRYGTTDPFNNLSWAILAFGILSGSFGFFAPEAAVEADVAAVNGYNYSFTNNLADANEFELINADTGQIVTDSNGFLPKELSNMNDLNELVYASRYGSKGLITLNPQEENLTFSAYFSPSKNLLKTTTSGGGTTLGQYQTDLSIPYSLSSNGILDANQANTPASTAMLTANFASGIPYIYVNIYAENGTAGNTIIDNQLTNQVELTDSTNSCSVTVELSDFANPEIKSSDLLNALNIHQPDSAILLNIDYTDQLATLSYATDVALRTISKPPLPTTPVGNTSQTGIVLTNFSQKNASFSIPVNSNGDTLNNISLAPGGYCRVSKGSANFVTANQQNNYPITEANSNFSNALDLYTAYDSNANPQVAIGLDSALNGSGNNPYYLVTNNSANVATVQDNTSAQASRVLLPYSANSTANTILGLVFIPQQASLGEINAAFSSIGTNLTSIYTNATECSQCSGNGTGSCGNTAPPPTPASIVPGNWSNSCTVQKLDTQAGILTAMCKVNPSCVPIPPNPFNPHGSGNICQTVISMINYTSCPNNTVNNGNGKLVCAD